MLNQTSALSPIPNNLNKTSTSASGSYHSSDLYRHKLGCLAHLKVSERFDFVRRKVLSLSNLLTKLYAAATIAALRRGMPPLASLCHGSGAALQ